MEEVPMALVDSGWTGSMQKEICQALGILGKKGRVTGYYWGLYELPEGVRREDYHCYYFSPEAGLKKKVYFSNSLFESIFSAPHGMTTGYEKVHGQWRPVYARTDAGRKKFPGRTGKNTAGIYEKSGGFYETYRGSAFDQRYTGNREVIEPFYGKAQIPGSTDIRKSALF